MRKSTISKRCIKARLKKKHDCIRATAIFKAHDNGHMERARRVAQAAVGMGNHG